MKKLSILVCLISSLLFTGCDEKTLDCVREEEMEYAKINNNQVITFNGDKIKKYEATMKVELNEDYLDYADLFIASLEDSFEDFKSKDGITYEISNDDDSILATILGDYDKMDNDTKDSLDISDGSYQVVKQTLEEEGYTCK